MSKRIKERFMQMAIDEMKGMKQRRPSADELNKYFVGCDGIWRGYDPNTHWCGIFVTYLLRKAGAQVRWIYRRGIHNVTGYENIEGYMSVWLYGGNKNISPGDICVRGDGEHHFIVISPPDKHGTFEHCVEGNFGGLGNPQLHQGKWWKDRVKDVKYYYRIT